MVDSQMRAAWSRRTDEELLRACFIEELTPEGRRVVDALVAEKLGSREAYVRRFEDEQGDEVARIPVRGCEVDPVVKDAALPTMWGAVVLTANGVGFIPGGHDDQLAEPLGARVGGIFGRAGGSVLSEMRRTSHPITDLTNTKLPIALLATIDASSIWLPLGDFDAVLWGPDFGEILQNGERLLSVEPAHDAHALVATWAAAHGVPFTLLEPESLLR